MKCFHPLPNIKFYYAPATSSYIISGVSNTKTMISRSTLHWEAPDKFWAPQVFGLFNQPVTTKGDTYSTKAMILPLVTHLKIRPPTASWCKIALCYLYLPTTVETHKT